MEMTTCVGFEKWGGPEVLHLRDVPVPEPQDGQILVEVAAATVNPADTHLRSGGLAGMISGERPYYGGLELAGTVVATGGGTRWKAGDAVAGLTVFIPSGRGAHARHVVIDERSAASIPPGLDMPRAAAVPMSGITARLAIDKAMEAGNRVAITGAVGAVGSIALCLARREGVESIAVVRAGQMDRARELGAEHAVDAARAVEQLKEIAPEGVDAVIDCALLGEAAAGAIRDGGYYGGLRPYQMDFGRGIRMDLIGMPEYLHEQQKLLQLMDLAGAGELSVEVARVLPPRDAAEAHRLVEQGGLGGRVSLDFSDM